MWSLLQSKLNNDSVTSCKDMEYACYDKHIASDLARYFCPEVCGTDSFISGQFNIASADGVAMQCGQVAAKELQTEPRRELTAVELQHHDPWLNYIKSFHSAMNATLPRHVPNETAVTEFVEFGSNFAAGMYLEGCDWFSRTHTRPTGDGGHFSFDYTQHHGGADASTATWLQRPASAISSAAALYITPPPGRADAPVERHTRRGTTAAAVAALATFGSIALVEALLQDRHARSSILRPAHRIGYGPPPPTAG